jgi:ABC-type polysaccharide transport system permease subunit
VKKFIPFILAMPALLLLIFFKIIPIIYTVVLSTRDFFFASNGENNVLEGLLQKSPAGLKAYSALFGMEGFRGAVLNTLRLSAFSILLTCLLALFLIVCISKMPRRWLKLLAIILLAIPAFIPVTSFVWAFSSGLSPESGLIARLFTPEGAAPKLFFGDPALYPFLYAIMDAMRNVYIPVILGVLVCEDHSAIAFRKIAFVMAGYAAARATVFMSPDIETLMVSSNPLVAISSNVLDMIRYQSVRMTTQYNVSAAAWVFKSVLQLIICIAAYFALKALSPSVARSVGRLDKKTGSTRGAIAGILGYVLFAAGSITVILLTFIQPFGRLAEGAKILLEDNVLPTAFANSLLHGILSCVLYGIVTLLLAYPLTASRKLYPLILLVLVSLSNNFIGEYIWYHKLGMINTVFPLVLGPGLSVIGAFALHFCVTAGREAAKWDQGLPGFIEYARVSLLPLLTIVAIAFLANWGGYSYQERYLGESSAWGVGFYGRQILFASLPDFMMDGDWQAKMMNAKSAFVFLSSIVPAALGALLIGLHRIFPLSAFVSQIRKG